MSPLPDRVLEKYRTGPACGSLSGNGPASLALLFGPPVVAHPRFTGSSHPFGRSRLAKTSSPPQKPGRFDQDLRFGAGNLRGAFWTVDAIEGAASGRAYDGYVHFDFKPPRTEDMDGVWASARACMRNYLILRSRVRAFRADPEVQEALTASRVDQLAVPTLAPGESLAALREEKHDIDAMAARGMGFERLDQLAMEHLLGAR